MNQPQSTKPTNKQFATMVLLGTLLTLITGVVYGRLSQRWGPSVDLIAAGDHLQSMPKQIGDWLMIEEFTMSDRVVNTLECAGYTNRRYQNQLTGETISISLLVGPAGPIAVHTPEICYSSRNHSIEEKATATEFAVGEEPPNSLWRNVFLSNDISAERLAVYYGWSQGNTWHASYSPRFEYGGEPLLYKLQIAGPLIGDGSEEGHRDPCRDFLEAFLRTNWRVSKLQMPV